MHNAPPVVFPVGRFVWGNRWLVSLALVGALGLLCWQLWAGPSGMLVLCAILFWGVCSALAFALWRHEQLGAGHLIWSDGDWQWRAHGQPEMAVRVNLIWDASEAMLLAIDAICPVVPAHRLSRYAWLTRGAMPSAWHGFRCAVCARQGADADNASGAAH